MQDLDQIDLRLNKFEHISAKLLKFQVDFFY